MTSIDIILMVQAVASAAMCGIIWFVQVVHYPLFARSTGDGSEDHARENQARTSRVVIPFMLAEAATAAAVVAAPPPGIGRTVAVGGAALVGLAWLSTLAVQMPLHARLAAEGHDPQIVGRLVATNWLRTLAWTIRAGLAAWMLRAAA